MAQRQLDGTDYAEIHESTDFRNGAPYYVPPADFDPLTPAANFQAIVNAAAQLSDELQFNHDPINITIIPSQARRIFSLAQNLIIRLFITTMLHYLSDFIDPSHIQIRIEYEVLTVQCRDEFALVMLVLVMSTWVDGPFSLILSELVPRFRYNAIIPGLTVADDTILSRLGKRNVGVDASGWYIEFLGLLEGGMHVGFDIEYRSSLALEARGFMVNCCGQNVHFTFQG